MSWLHIARIPGPDGTGAWLVVPGIDDRVFSWAMATVQSPVPFKSLKTFRGWLVPVAAENALWSVIAQTYGTGVVCPECFHGDLPCEAWINLVTNRFEAAHAEAMNKQALPERGARDSGARTNYEDYANNGNYGNGSYNPYYDTRSGGQDNFGPSQNNRRGYSRPTYDSYTSHEAPKRRKPASYDYTPPPKPPEPTRAERLSDAAKTLGVTWPASKEEIKKAFKKAALRSHPDMGGSDQAFIQVKQARDTLIAAT